MLTPEEIKSHLRSVLDPELGVNIVDLGLLYNIECTEEGIVNIRMTLTTPGCPLHDSITGGVKTVLGSVPGVTGVEVEVVWSPPWTPERMTDAARKQLGMLR